eukprot:9073515-Pyramimonas_sp.AAC.1
MQVNPTAQPSPSNCWRLFGIPSTSAESMGRFASALVPWEAIVTRTRRCGLMATVESMRTVCKDFKLKSQAGSLGQLSAHACDANRRNAIDPEEEA